MITDKLKVTVGDYFWVDSTNLHMGGRLTEEPGAFVFSIEDDTPNDFAFISFVPKDDVILKEGDIYTLKMKFHLLNGGGPYSVSTDTARFIGIVGERE